MCFSATASFTASALLTAAGIATLCVSKNQPKLYCLALVPLLFALQQFSEGILWLSHNNGLLHPGWQKPGELVFLMAAYFLWPVWMPLATWIPEKDRSRKNVIFFFLLGGVIWTIYQFYIFAKSEITVNFVGDSIQYIIQERSTPEYFFIAIIYMLIILIPLFVSSLEYLWVFGLLVAVSAALTHYFYKHTFTSVWCFFSALMSAGLFLILYRNKNYFRIWR